MGRRQGQVGLLNFKEADKDAWVDSKEGGVYAYLVVPTPVYDDELSNHLERCMVETYPTLRHAHLVSSSGHPHPEAAEDDYWDDLYERQEGDLHERQEGYRFFRYKHPIPIGDRIEGKDPEEIRRMTTAYIHAYEGGPFYAVVYLGSSGESVYNIAQAEVDNIFEPYTFWPIYTRDDLTEEGQQLYDTLKGLYQTEPVILLFLDT